MHKKTALITGASQGIGYELSKLFAKDGYNLVLVARDEKRLNDIKMEFLKEHQVDIQIVVKDLSNPNSAQEIFESLKLKNTIVTALVNNAGFGHLGKFSETDWDLYQKMIQLNISSLTRLTHLFLPDMLDMNRGYIMNVASTAAFMPGPLMSIYYASKAFVLSFSQALANELKDSSVIVNTLCPGPTETKFQKRAKMDNRNVFNNSIMHVMDAETVAKQGYQDLMQGKTLTITGSFNKLLTQSIRVSPRNMVINVTRWLMDKRG